MLTIYRDSDRAMLLQESTSRNSKTGDLANLWIVPLNGCAEAVCGDCALLHAGCYAHAGRTGMVSRKAAAKHTDGPIASEADILRAIRGRIVRSAVIGDTAFIPVAVWQAMPRPAGSLGYTHQWRHAEHLRGSHMASVETLPAAQEAWSKGWRTFRVIERDAEPWKGRNELGEVACPAWSSGGRVQCAECRYCDGAESGKASVAIAAHGAQARRVKLTIEQ